MKNSNVYKEGYAIGVKTACAAYNSTPTDFFKAASCVEAAMDTVPVQHMIAKIASHIFANAGDEFAPERSVYEVIQTLDTPVQEFSKQAFLYPVVDTIAAYSEASLTKEASIAGTLTSLLSGGPQAITALALGGGAALGGLGWLLNRDSNTMEDETEAKLAQAEYYRNIARDLQRRLKAKEEGSLESKELQKAVEEAGEGGMLI